MKSTGIVRKVDELGRIVIPKELRNTLNIEEKDSLEIYVDGEHIILKKYEPACIFCACLGLQRQEYLPCLHGRAEIRKIIIKYKRLGLKALTFYTLSFILQPY